MEIYTFDKSLQERLVEFSEILSSRREVVPASQVKLEWSYHVELVIEPVGWQALWKIPRLTCQDFKIHYPTIVMIEVEQVDFNELSALVRIVAVQDEIHLPEKYDVPLIELYPTHKQENAALDMIGTASCIDQLRFFFNYLWMPWDIDDDDNADWVGLHLEPRIRLFFDMKRGIVSKETCDVIRSLIREGREVQERISKLEESISEEEENQDRLTDDGKTCQLMQLHFRLQQIKTEMEVLENPAIRDMLARNHNSSMTEQQIRNKEDQNKPKEAYFVWLGSTLEELRKALEKVETNLPENILIKTCGSLQEALHIANVGDIMILGEGHHRITSSGALEEGGTIKGIHNVEYTTLFPSETKSAPSLLDFSGKEVLLENVSIDLGELQAGIIVRKGILKVMGCKIYASNQSVVKLGIVILPGAKIVLENTNFDGLGTAVVIYAMGNVEMNNCTFNNCVEGIQLHDDAVLMATKCTLGHFKEYAIRMETEKYLTNSDSKSGGVELLQGISEISLHDCRFEDNCKADVTLKPKAAMIFTAKQDCSINMEP